ncbi:exosortase F system-associated protein [Flavobacterium ponti]|uniref:Exosortase F system-associated protein n=1 Tax=Flavobacterium ponti TaxID=665133 RepID=A0ABV9P0E7_9FLAO
MPNKLLRYIGISIALLLIVSIRFFEHKLFYDPFLQFFKSEYQNKSLPEFDTFKLFLNLFLRFIANTILSITILYLFFLNKMHIKIAAVLYVILFVILISVLFYLLLFSSSPNYLFLFYIRRFLIQPIMLLLLIPAFYFQKLTSQ